MIRPRGFPSSQATAESLCKQVHGARWRDLCASDADPVMRSQHSLNQPSLDPKTAVAIHDAGEISASLLSSPAQRTWTEPLVPEQRWRQRQWASGILPRTVV